MTLENPTNEIQKQILALVQAVEKLRGPGGCPWDQEQNHQSLAPYALEEVCELLEALDTSNYDLMREELGDVLFQVVLHSELARESDQFTLAEVTRDITEKIIRRHPHVFGNTQVSGTEEVLKNWEDIKRKEKEQKKTSSATSTFNIPPHLPALSASNKIGEKTARSGFDWNNIQGVLDKLDEEIQELKEALKTNELKNMEHEIGDVLFSVAQIARHKNLDPETALRKTNRRFEKRYFKMLEIANDEQKKWSQLSLAQKEKYWKKSKAALRESEQ